MILPIYAGSSSGFGEGGLGGHLSFIQKAAHAAGRPIQILCREKPAKLPPESCLAIPAPAWTRAMKYSPIRWSPAIQSALIGRQFDVRAAERLPERPIVYHCFPGFAEESFKKVKRWGGVTVLEAATTHADHVYEVTEAEHRKYRMGGSPFSRQWLRRVRREYELADYITIASALQRDSFISRGVPAERLLYAPLGIDTARFAGPSPEARRRTDGSKFRIVQVGQITLRKGFMYLLEAVRLLNDPEIEVVLVGGIGWRAIRESIDHYKSLGVAIRHASGDPLPALREAHLYVHASVEDGFGLAPLEAMSSGLPAVVTNQTGMQDLIEDGLDGLVVPSRDSRRLAEAIALLKKDEAKRLAMGEAAARKARNYDAGAAARRYANTLRPAWG
ncbi:glycosyltransferase family 4 protein [Cohnella rhizosphaerae]|uniref:Glycosyltransferase family 4 protein n=1 Tax=Cohnella rhizosphaerae TaxID=1457232 RepID=A0A9X4L0S1_9BACL|nr:glycosyltransferase family 4 protein [Cohnella rhizosphaerae]MDG0814428.1 glycosyltransferase family 4 protein [Cohnella rhizosphaerae]